ncbi:MAG TPA: type II secretion system F family protein [Acidimicrobiia bacterium]|nr:type II secretion system F family protein [Acidimicrobiia bacterium]
MLTLAVAVLGLLVATALMIAARRTATAERTRALGAHRRWRLHARPRAALARALADAELTLEPEPAVELWAGTAAAAGIVALALSPGLVPPAVLLAGAGPPALLWVLRTRAHRRYAAALPLALEQIAAHLRGGGTVGHGVAALSGGDGPLAADLRRVQARADLGVGLADALAAWPAERDVGDVRAVAGALAVAETLGGRSSHALDGLAASLRDRLGAAAEAHSLSAQARLSALVVGASPLVYLVFSALVDPASVGLLVRTNAGRLCLGLGLLLEVVAVLWMRRILASAEAA